MNRPYQDYGPSSGTLFRQIADLNQNANLPFNYCVLGVQRYGNTRQLFDYASESETTYVLAQDMVADHCAHSIQLIVGLIEHTDSMMIPIDMDVFAQIYALGVSVSQALRFGPITYSIFSMKP